MMQVFKVCPTVCKLHCLDEALFILSTNLISVHCVDIYSWLQCYS